MKIFTPQISWHDRQPILSIDIQNRIHSETDSIRSYRLATGGNDSHVIIWAVSIPINTQKDEGDNPNKKKKPIENIQCLSELTQHLRSVNVVRFSPKIEDNYLASGDDDGYIYISKLIDDENERKQIEPSENIENINSDVIAIEVWKTYKILHGHNKDVLDLCWNADGQYIVSCSVDNNVLIWDVQRGVQLNKMSKEHSSYVQGVTWDPLNRYIASLSADRNLIIYNSKNGKTLHKITKINFEDNTKLPSSSRLFFDQTMMSFFRRLTFTPGGELLLAPSGIIELGNDKFDNVVHIFERKSLNRPSFYLPTDKFSVAIKCCPIVFELQDGKENMFNFPYRIVFAVATQDSVLFYDSQQFFPFAYASQLHYLRLTDISWSSDGKMIIVTSTDGFSTFIIFDENELGIPYQGKLMDFEEVDNLNLNVNNTKQQQQQQQQQDSKTPSKSKNNVDNQCGDKSIEKKPKSVAKVIKPTSTPITNFFKKCSQSPTNDNNNKNNSTSQSKPGRRVQLITLFKPHQENESASSPIPQLQQPTTSPLTTITTTQTATIAEMNCESKTDDESYTTGTKRNIDEIK